MSSPVEVLLGRRREAWGARERWSVRCFIAAAAFLAALLPRLLPTPAHPYHPWTPYVFWAVLFAGIVVVLAERRLPRASGSENPGK